MPLLSCSRLSTDEQAIKDTLNKKLHLGVFNKVLTGNKEISFHDFRQKYKHISVIYLKDGCHYCYPKFVEWHHKMDSIGTPDDYTVLFVIKGKKIEDFLEKVPEIDLIENHYPVIIDTDSRFIKNNVDIPISFLNCSVLIDDENKIKLIGEPFITPQMTDLFLKMCESDSY